MIFGKLSDSVCVCVCVCVWGVGLKNNKILVGGVGNWLLGVIFSGEVAFP